MGAAKVFSGVVNLASNCECSNLVSFPDMTFFYDFFKNFQRKLVFKNFQNFQDVNPVVENCEGTVIGLQILPLIMTAQILVVFEI